MSLLVKEIPACAHRSPAHRARRRRPPAAGPGRRVDDRRRGHRSGAARALPAAHRRLGPVALRPVLHGQVVPPDANPVLYLNGEVEPWVAVNPRNPLNVVGVWQQDRWSDGGANALRTGYCSTAAAAGAAPRRRSATAPAATPPTAATTSAPPTRGCRSGPPASRTRSASRSTTTPRTRRSSPAARPPTAAARGAARDADRRPAGQEHRLRRQGVDHRGPARPRLVYAVWDRLVTNAAGTATITGNTEFTRSTDGGRTGSRCASCSTRDRQPRRSPTISPSGRTARSTTWPR